MAAQVIGLDLSRRSAESKDFGASLRGKIVGQDEAVQAVVDLYQVFRAGLDSPGRPVGNLLFLGPTGAGKTRVVEATAKVLGGALCVSSPGAFTLRWDSSIHRADYPRATLNWSARKSHGRNRSELATPQGFDHN